MTALAQIEVSLHRFHRARGQVIFEPKPRPEEVPRLARALALAHYLVSQVEGGSVRDYGILASRLGISQARVSALVSLTFLAPSVQEEILAGRSRLGEKALVILARERSWARQHQNWERAKRLRDSALKSTHKDRELEAQSLTPSSKLYQVEAPLPPLALAHLALGHTEAIRQIDLGQPRSLPGLLEASQ